MRNGRVAKLVIPLEQPQFYALSLNNRGRFESNRDSGAPQRKAELPVSQGGAL